MLCTRNYELTYSTLSTQLNPRPQGAESQEKRRSAIFGLQALHKPCHILPIAHSTFIMWPSLSLIQIPVPSPTKAVSGSDQETLHRSIERQWLDPGSLSKPCWQLISNQRSRMTWYLPVTVTIQKQFVWQVIADVFQALNVLCSTSSIHVEKAGALWLLWKPISLFMETCGEIGYKCTFARLSCFFARAENNQINMYFWRQLLVSGGIQFHFPPFLS